MPKPSVDGSLNILKRFSDEGIARLISDLGNPLFMPPVVFVCTCLLLSQSLETTVQIFTTAAICYTILPFALTLYLFKTGAITSIDLPIRRTRTALYAFSIGSATLAMFAIFRFIPSAHPFLHILSVVFLINISIAFLLNLKWKISVHSASVAVAGTVYAFLYFLGITEYTSITIILSLFHLLVLLPVMVWGRFHLKAHTAGELIGGSSSGIILTILEILIIQYLW
jgi:hypothetical protein